MGGFLTQLLPPSPTLTEKNLPSLVDKVFIVTGGNAGIGLELVKILYSKGGTVYIASRSPTKVASAIEDIKALHPTSTGYLKPLHLDLGDLSTIPKCAETFLAQESRLDILFNNAGISRQPAGTVSAQGHEIHMATNCIGPFLLTKLLLPILLQTAKSAPKASVRVVFSSSSIIEMASPPGGLSLAEQRPGNYSKDLNRNYSASKAGDWFLASEFSKRYFRDAGIVSVAHHPGTLKTKSWDNVSWIMKGLFKPFFYDPNMGAYTALWCGFSVEVGVEDGERYAIPWGRWHPDPKKELLASLKTKEEGGTGLAGEFWAWCEECTKEFA